MNPSILQCHNCWKWGHSTFLCRAYRSKCQKYSSPHKLEHYREIVQYCKANPKTNPPRSKTRPGEPCLYTFKCINCKGKYIADSNKYPLWKHYFNCEWYTVMRQSKEKKLFLIHSSTQQIISRSIMQEGYKQCGKAYVRYIVISKNHMIIGDRCIDQQIFV